MQVNLMDLPSIVLQNIGIKVFVISVIVFIGIHGILKTIMHCINEIRYGDEEDKEISYHEEIQKLHDAYIEYVINELAQDQKQPNHVSGMIFERILK